MSIPRVDGCQRTPGNGASQKATRLEEPPVYQVSFLNFFLYLEILLLYIYLLINCLVHLFNLLLYLISYLIYSFIIFLVSVLLLFIYLIKLVVDIFFNNSIYFYLTHEPSPTLNLLKSQNLKNSSSKFSFLKF